MFTELYSIALAEWPALLSLPLRGSPGAFVVDGLTQLEQKISSRWVGQPQEVLMVNLNWAIATAYHDAFRSLTSVARQDLDISVVRNKFEGDLKRIQSGKVPTWTDADRAVVASYFRSGAL